MLYLLLALIPRRSLFRGSKGNCFYHKKQILAKKFTKNLGKTASGDPGHRTTARKAALLVPQWKIEPQQTFRRALKPVLHDAGKRSNSA
jgi:hypothetical protein